MPTNRKARKIEAFGMHCRNEKEPVDYTAFFGRIADASIVSRNLQIGDKLVALSVTVHDGEIVKIIAYEGPVGVNPLIFDATSGKEQYQTLDVDQVVATRTYALVDLHAKEALIEYNQRGAKAHDIAEVLESTARGIGLGERVSVELIPKADQSFLEALDRFGRVKVAAIKVAQPNFDWNDNYESMNVVGAQSNARTVELIAVANRNDSLSRDNGVVQYLRQMLTSLSSRNLKAAHVAGVRLGETADTRISLANYIQHQKVNVRVDQHGHVLGDDIWASLSAYLEERRRMAKE